MFKLVIVFDNKKINKVNLSGMDFPDHDICMRLYLTEVLFNIMLECIF